MNEYTYKSSSNNLIKFIVVFYCLSILCISFAFADEAKYISKPPQIDGVANDQEWGLGTWYPINKNIIGELPDEKDFKASYTLRWHESALFIWVQLQDDVLYDQHPNPLDRYWDDDCLEIFIDEDASGGDHQHNYQAFAYHVALDNQVVDIGKQHPDGTTHLVLLNEHVESQWKRSSTPPYEITWELAIKIYDDSFNEATNNNKPVALKANKRMGFMLAYCDNDGSEQRESFIGSHDIEAVNGDKNRGYIDASVFDELHLLKK